MGHELTIFTYCQNTILLGMPFITNVSGDRSSIWWALDKLSLLKIKIFPLIIILWTPSSNNLLLLEFDHLKHLCIFLIIVGGIK